MNKPIDKNLVEFQDNCQQLIEHIKVLRDYATTPGNIWLAKSELAKINQITAELDSTLSRLDKPTS